MIYSVSGNKIFNGSLCRLFLVAGFEKAMLPKDCAKMPTH